MAQQRPPCVVNARDIAGETRPRFTQAEGVAAVVRTLSDPVGLTKLGVHLRTVEPGNVGTHRHFHTVEEEWAYVVSGRGAVRIGPLTLPVTAGTFVGFPPGPRPHHFLAEGEEPLVLLEGGERRRSEDGGWYPDARKMWRDGAPAEPYEEPAPEEGEASQVVAPDDLPPTDFTHPVDPGARIAMRVLHVPTGLARQGVRWARVQPGDRSTAYHTHEATDEWVYVLAGRAMARVGETRFEIGPGDFVGHPAGSAPHTLEATEELTYLMGGGSDPNDVVLYPDAGLRRAGGKLRPM